MYIQIIIRLFALHVYMLMTNYLKTLRCGEAVNVSYYHSPAWKTIEIEKYSWKWKVGHYELMSITFFVHIII